MLQLLISVKSDFELEKANAYTVIKNNLLKYFAPIF